jgi:hypothetical protein
VGSPSRAQRARWEAKGWRREHDCGAIGDEFVPIATLGIGDGGESEGTTAGVGSYQEEVLR